MKHGNGIKGRDDKSSGIEILMTEGFAKINPTDPLRLAKQAARRNRNWPDSSGSSLARADVSRWACRLLNFFVPCTSILNLLDLSWPWLLYTFLRGHSLRVGAACALSLIKPDVFPDAVHKLRIVEIIGHGAGTPLAPARYLWRSLSVVLLSFHDVSFSSGSHITSEVRMDS